MLVLLNASNCSDNTVKKTHCDIISVSQATGYTLYGSIVVALLGTLLNLLSLFIFTFSHNMDTKFLRYLKYYVLNSVIVTLNYLVLATLFAVTISDDKIYRLDFSTQLVNSYDYAYWFTFVFMTVWTVSYSFGSLIEMIIAYERILMYKPKMQFMRNVNIHVTLAAIFIIACLINLPANLSRDVHTTMLTFNKIKPANLTIKVYTLGGKRTFSSHNDLFTMCLYVSTFLRDSLTLVIDLAITLSLIITIVKFYNGKQKLKRQIKAQRKVNSDPIVFRKTDMNNSKVALLICFVSSLGHLGTFLSLLVLFFLESKSHQLVISITGFFYLCRNCLNFFLFLKYNMKFKRNFIRLLPDCLKAKRPRTLARPSGKNGQ